MVQHNDIFVCALVLYAVIHYPITASFPCVSASTKMDDCFSIFMISSNTVYYRILVTWLLLSTGLSVLIPIFLNNKLLFVDN